MARRTSRRSSGSTSSSRSSGRTKGGTGRRSRRGKQEEEQENPEEELEEPDEEADEYDEEEDEEEEYEEEESSREKRGRSSTEASVTPGKAIAMTVFLGLFGAGRFVMGYTGIGIAQIALTLLMIAGIVAPPSALNIPQGFWFTLPYLALAINVTIMLHDLALLGSGLMVDARLRPILPETPEGTPSKKRTRDKSFLLSLFAGPFGAGRFYISDYVQGSIKLGITVVSILLILLSLPAWVGLRDYRVAGLFSQEATKNADNFDVMMHRITVSVLAPDVPLSEINNLRETYSEQNKKYFSTLKELRQQQKNLPTYIPPDTPGALNPDVMTAEEIALANEPRDIREAREDGLPIFTSKTIERYITPESESASSDKLNAEIAKAENRVWRGFVEGQKDDKGRKGKSVVQATRDLWEHSPIQLGRPILGYIGLGLFCVGCLFWAYDLVRIGGGDLRSPKGTPIGFPVIPERFKEQTRQATLYIEIGCSLFFGAFLCLLAVVYTGWPNAYGQPSLLEGVELGFFASLLLVMTFVAMGAYRLYVAERISGEIRDEKVALAHELQERERAARAPKKDQGEKKKRAPLPAKKKTVKKSKTKAKASPPPDEDEADDAADGGGDEDTGPSKKGKAPRARRRRRRM